MSTTFIITGYILTGIGIIFTIIGTFQQKNESDTFQNKITGLTEKTNSSQEKVEFYIQKNIELSEKLSQQSIESEKSLIKLSVENAELTKKLTDLSEERFRKLTIPTLNVLKIEENLSLGLNSYFKIIAKNTGNNDCLDARLYVDRHNSPFAKPGFLTIQNFKKVPKSEIVEYKIPLFQSGIIVNVANDEQKSEYSDFLKRYNNDELAVIVFFHFEYEWNNETLKSSQYSIVKSKDRKVYGSSSEDYVESE
jgi:hypothetical protein